MALIRGSVSLGLGSMLVTGLMLGRSPALSQSVPVIDLPPPEDVPEEILRTEIILEGRSPINNEPLTAAEYAELQAQLEAGPDTPPTLSPDVRQTVFLLQLRRLFRGLIPFL